MPTDGVQRLIDQGATAIRVRYIKRGVEVWIDFHLDDEAYVEIDRHQPRWATRDRKVQRLTWEQFLTEGEALISDLLADGLHCTGITELPR